MAKLNIDNAIETIASALEDLRKSESKRFGSVGIGFRRGREIASGEYPIAMVGLESAALGDQTDSGDVLLVCLVRGRSVRGELTALRAAVCDLIALGFDDIQIDDIALGDLFPGYTESAEVAVLPTGAYIASWLGIERPAAGFYITFKMTVDAG